MVDLVELVEDVAAGQVDGSAVDGHMGEVEHARVFKF